MKKTKEDVMLQLFLILEGHGYTVSKDLNSRIEGLHEAKFIPQKDWKVEGLKFSKYEYTNIYYVIDYLTDDIDRALKNNEFNNNTHMVNYIMKIITSEIDDVLTTLSSMMKNLRKMEETK